MRGKPTYDTHNALDSATARARRESMASELSMDFGNSDDEDEVEVQVAATSSPVSRATDDYFSIPVILAHESVSSAVDTLNLPPVQRPSVSRPTTPADSGRARTSFKASMKRKLQRSKSSIRSLRRPKDDSRTAENDDEGEIDARSKKFRLRSLFSISRSGSSVSVISTASATSVAGPTASAPSQAGRSTPSYVATPGVMARDFASLSMQQAPLSRASSGQSPLVLDSTGAIVLRDLEEPVVHKPGSHLPLRTRPPFASALSGPLFAQETSHVEAGIFPRIRTRAVSMPIMQISKDPSIPPKVDLFSTMLPRELQLMIFKVFLGLERRGQGQWTSDTGARRELFSLARVSFSIYPPPAKGQVSKAWQDLCFDGQLWTQANMAPFAPYLQPQTFRRLIRGSAAFLTSLNLHGLDNLGGVDMIVSLSALDKPISLPKLTSLDLRGCKHLNSVDICFLVSLAPKLKHINLKGVQGVSSEVLRQMAVLGTKPEQLDVSRCWDLSLGNISVFIRSLSDSQAASLKVLRIAGLKGYGHGAADLLPLISQRLVNLQHLDLNGIAHIFDGDFETFTSSSISHLNLSQCASLTTVTLSFLIDRLPSLTRFEMAGIPEAFRERDDRPIIDFLHAVPRLSHLDVEGSGLYGGITDRVLEVLIRNQREDGGPFLHEIKLGYAKALTSEGLVRLVRGCLALQVLEADVSAMKGDSLTCRIQTRITR